MKQKILIVEDKATLAQMLKRTLQGEGFAVSVALSMSEGIKAIAGDPALDLVLTDLRLPDGDGLAILKKAKERQPPLQVIIMTAYGAIDIAVKAVKDGAYDFLTKPFDVDHLVNLIRQALDESPARPDAISVGLLSDNIKMVGVSQAWTEVVEKAKKVALMKTTVLILGESGTGKELIARYIHNNSQRSHQPFVPVNCSAIPKDLVENELFGHEKGAFTGAGDFKPGRFDMADKGTILLDEVGDMDISLQAKILRVIQESEFVRVGGSKVIKVDVRVIAASNRDLRQDVDRGLFRADMYYRLNVFPIVIPPLRERREDIIPIAEYYLSFFSGHKKGLRLSETASNLLQSYQWPGNVRELRNAIERAVILCDSDLIGPELFDIAVSGTSDSDGSLHSVSATAQRQAEMERIREALRQSGGNKTRAAELLKISYKTLLTKIKEYGI